RTNSVARRKCLYHAGQNAGLNRTCNRRMAGPGPRLRSNGRGYLSARNETSKYDPQPYLRILRHFFSGRSGTAVALMTGMSDRTEQEQSINHPSAGAANGHILLIGQPESSGVHTYRALLERTGYLVS